MSSAGFPGHSISENKPVLIFDLDGTILSINSFPHWVWYMLFGSFGGLTGWSRCLLFLRTATIMVRRKLLGRSHFVTKRNLQHLWAEAVCRDDQHIALHAFTALLRRRVRPNVEPLLKTLSTYNTDAVLATAAVSDYAHALGQMLGFQHILATPLGADQQALENSKEQKRDNVLAFLAAQGWGDRRRIFLTDHREDLPLMQESQLILWFGDDNVLEVVRAELQGKRAVACLAMSDAAIMELVTGH
jgi:phosphoserine phosphatase